MMEIARKPSGPRFVSHALNSTFVLARWGHGTIVRPVPGRNNERVRQSKACWTEGVPHMNSVYAAWKGQPVVLQIATEGMRVPLRGVVVGESDDVVKFNLGDGLEHRHFQEHDSWQWKRTVGPR